MYRRSQRWMLIINNRFLSVYDYNFLLYYEKIFSVKQPKDQRFKTAAKRKRTSGMSLTLKSIMFCPLFPFLFITVVWLKLFFSLVIHYLKLMTYDSILWFQLLISDFIFYSLVLHLFSFLCLTILSLVHLFVPDICFLIHYELSFHL